MPLLSENNGTIKIFEPTDFPLEKELQSLIENHLEEIFHCKFIATEFSTGDIHAGRMDTLAISEENHPVIIEYKIKKSSSLINQALSYMYWLQDHTGDFEKAVDKNLSPNIKVDWRHIRLICIAPEYAKHDLNAVKKMNYPFLELWQYQRYENNMLNIVKIFPKEKVKTSNKNKNVIQTNTPINNINNDTIVYTYEQHCSNLENETLKKLVDKIREYLKGLNDNVKEVPQQQHMTYKITKMFCNLEFNKDAVIIYLNFNDNDSLKYKKYGYLTKGHWGVMYFRTEFNIHTDMEIIKAMIKTSFENIVDNNKKITQDTNLVIANNDDYEQYFKGFNNKEIKERADVIRKYLLNFSNDVKERKKKSYMTYKISKKIFCRLEKKADNVKIHLNFKKEDFLKFKKYATDVSGTNHVPDSCVTYLNTHTDMEILKEMIQIAFENSFNEY